MKNTTGTAVNAGDVERRGMRNTTGRAVNAGDVERRGMRNTTGRAVNAADARKREMRAMTGNVCRMAQFLAVIAARTKRAPVTGACACRRREAVV